MLPRPDMLLDRTGDLEVIQLTTDPRVPSSHIYMESHVCTPDSRFVVLRRSGHPHGAAKDDPHHALLLCDLHDNYKLSVLTDELGVTGPAVSPDGTYVYYFVNETELNSGRLILKRVRLDGSERITIMVLDTPLPGAKGIASRPYSLSTISADGAKIAISAFIGDGYQEPPHWGLIVFHIEKATAELVLAGPTWGNMHPQYSRSLDPLHSNDILVQENHNRLNSPSGAFLNDDGDPLGIDIHVIKDDGTQFRTLPWGRDGEEFCQGHQCWVGRTTWAITSTWCPRINEHQLIAGLPVAHRGHLGKTLPEGIRHDLSGQPMVKVKPAFYHFATDLAGKRFITDSGLRDDGGGLYIASLHADGEKTLAFTQFQLVLRPGSSWHHNTHIHPALTPDGETAFFNSDESGLLQAYAVTGLSSLLA